MSKSNLNIVQKITALALPIIEENGLILWDVRFEKEGPDWILRILIERNDAPMDIDTCEKISRILSDILDEEDPIDHSYMLEVGSPGLGRRLYTNDHFKAKMGSKVLAHLYVKNEDGLKDISGILTSVEKENIKLQDEKTKRIYEVPFKSASYFKLCDDENLFK